jgi:putative transcriptional regulator
LRELIAAKAAALLQSQGYTISNFLDYNSCFDIAAKRANEIFLIKVFENADALREEQATELKKIAAAFNATALIIAEKTKAFALKNNVIYQRYDLPTISIASFSSMLKNCLPSIRCFKGKETVSIDSEKIKQKRKQLGLTLSNLAGKIGLSIQAMHRTEKNSQSSLATARKIENILKEKIIKQIDLFEKKPTTRIFDSNLQDDSFEKIQELGLKLALFDHAPFRAFSNPEEALLIDKGYSKQDLKKKAMLLGKTKPLIKGSHAFIISKETKYETIDNTPIIQEEELYSFSKARDLLETIKEREKKKRGK